jgi:hypothetical protein
VSFRCSWKILTFEEERLNSKYSPKLVPACKATPKFCIIEREGVYGDFRGEDGGKTGNVLLVLARVVGAVGPWARRAVRKRTVVGECPENCVVRDIEFRES